MTQSIKVLFLVLVSLASTGLARGQETFNFTLQEAIDFAWQNSNTIKNAQVNIIDADERIKENRAVGIPQLNGTVNYQRYLQVPAQALPDAFVNAFSALNPDAPVQREVSFFLKNNFSAALNLDALVFDGSYITAIKAAKVYREYVAQDLEVKKRDVKNQVIDAYLPVLLLDKNLSILDSNIINLEKLYQETQALYKEGFAEQLDVDRLELSLANLRVQQENLSRQKDIALNILRFSINAPEGSNVNIIEDLEDIEVNLQEEELAGSINLNGRPEIAYVNKGVELNDLNIKVNKMGYYPTLRAQAGYTTTYQSNTREDGFWAPNALVGLSLNVPIFDGWDKKAKIQRARLTKEISLNQLQDLENSISLEVNNARQALQTAQKSLDSQNKNLDLAKRIYKTTQIKYREGVGSSLEVNQAEQSLYSSQSNYIQALYDVTVAKFNLIKALGK